MSKPGMRRIRGRRFTRRGRGDFDAATMSQALARPGMDTRQWISYGIVDNKAAVDGGEPIDPVSFDEEFGPLVNVTLHPTGLPVRCRVGSDTAGNGEFEYTPFVSGDEVLVALPEGSERAAPVIIRRLTNTRDTFPMESVAGQDPTNNTFSFRRIRTPRIEEYADSYMLRSAVSGAFLLMSPEGTITLRDGSSGALQMSEDIFGYQNADGDALMQLDKTNGRVSLMIRDAILNLAASDNPDDPTSNLATNSSFAVSTLANTAAEHVVTLEQLCSILNRLFAVLSLSITAVGGPLTSANTAPIFATAGTVELPAALSLAATAPQDAALASAIVGALAAQPPKQTPVGPTGQLTPGVGCPGFLAG